MSDIDFDELDRAVNGVLGIPSNQNTPQPAATVTPQTLPTPQSPPQAPAVEHLDHVERTQLNYAASHPAQNSAPLVNSAPAARRSSGRFMDMVHPSSDMRSRGNTPPTATHLGSTPIPQPTPAPIETESPAWNEPLESPFLPDAKVEKRPLGGTVNETEAFPKAFDFQGLLDEPDDEVKNTPITAELKKEVNVEPAFKLDAEPEEALLEAPEAQERIEANTMPDPIDFAAGFTESDDIDSRINEVEAREARELTPMHADEPAAAPVVPLPVTPPAPQPVAQPIVAKPAIEEPVGPTSITPQYKEQPSSNQESGAMYDTESYHQALTAPVKKKSGWMTLVWILLLIALGAGAGWAVYTYVLPMI